MSHCIACACSDTEGVTQLEHDMRHSDARYGCSAYFCAHAIASVALNARGLTSQPHLLGNCSILAFSV